MTDLDKMARELLAVEYGKAGSRRFAEDLRSGCEIGDSDTAYAVQAIRSALLTAPPGYVLLPIDPGNMQLMWMGGHDEASQRRAYAGLLASAPEVK